MMYYGFGVENLIGNVNAAIILMTHSALLLFLRKVVLTTQGNWKREWGSRKGNYSEGWIFCLSLTHLLLNILQFSYVRDMRNYSLLSYFYSSHL